MLVNKMIEGLLDRPTAKKATGCVIVATRNDEGEETVLLIGGNNMKPETLVAMAQKYEKAVLGTAAAFNAAVAK